MPIPIVYVDSSDVHMARLPALMAAMNELADFVKENEPQLLAYNLYFSQDCSRLSVVAIHPDSASLEYHMQLGAPVFRKFAEFLTLRSIEVYGEVSTSVMELLQRKAAMLGGATVQIHERYAGFGRQNRTPPGPEASWGLAPGDMRG